MLTMRILIILILTLIALPAHAMPADEFASFEKWMSSDATDQNPYINVTYDCFAFSSAFAANASASGQRDIYMANLQGSKYPGGHWINAVLVDGEYIFVEPQADIIVEPEGASITILDDSMQGMKELEGKNHITITGNMLLPVKI